MRTSLIPLAFAVLSFTACDGGAPLGFCDQPEGIPTEDVLPRGQGMATKDGEAWQSQASWSTTSYSVSVGTLDMIVTRDEDGVSVRDLVGAGTFPICVRVGERDERTGQANLVDGGYVSDANHKGSVVLLAKENNYLVGRFSFTLANTSGDTVEFEEGMFRAGTF